MDDSQTIADLDGQAETSAIATLFGHGYPLTMDSRLWADAFCERYPMVDKEDVVAWFANAIMSGYNHRYIRGS